MYYQVEYRSRNVNFENKRYAMSEDLMNLETENNKLPCVTNEI